MIRSRLAKRWQRIANIRAAWAEFILGGKDEK